MVRPPLRALLAAAALTWGLCLHGAHAQSTAVDAVQAATPAAASATPAAAAPAPPASHPNSRFRITPVDDAWRANLPRNAEAATQAYLDRLPADVVARSNAYFEGRYGLQLVEFVLGLAIAALMLGRRRAARVRDWAQRVARHAWPRDALFGAVYALAGWVLTLPLTIYQGFVREHAYGMATQGFAAWGAEQLVAMVVTVLMTAIAVAVFYAVLRATGERWWLWGTVSSVALLAALVMAGPVFIDPLFNTYKAVEEGPIKQRILAMAHANGVPVDNVYEFDASRQTTRVSANVSGLGSTAAVRLNDNLLRRATPPEVHAVMGHEIGHYALNHVLKMMMQFGLIILFGFLFCQWAMARLFSRYGPRWGLQRVEDVASLPLLAAVLSVYMLACTPLINTVIRTQEVEADLHGLNLAREPHGFAEAILKLTEYRKPDPGALEEWVYFTHPSARNRILAAMRWREAMGTP
jgi:STE24 endopeptidase